MFRRSLYLAVHAAVFAAPLAASAEAPSTQPEVVVTATRVAEPVTDSLATVTVITREDIERRQAPDLLELLRLHAASTSRAPAAPARPPRSSCAAPIPTTR